MAGYAPSGARVRASELKRNPKVRACIDEMLMTKLKDGVCLAVQVLYDLARNAPPSVRLSAAKELLDRGIGPVPSRSTQQQGETLEDILFLLDEEEHNAQLLEGTAVQANRMPSGNGSVAAGSKGGFADKLSKCADQYASSESKYREKC